MSEEISIPNFTLYGILLIIVGIITFIVTFRRVVPTGSILLVLSGIIGIYLGKHGRNKNREVHDT